MKKAVIGVIVAVVVIGGGFLIFHKSNPKTPASSSSTNSSTTPVNNAVVVTKTSSTLGSYLTDPSGKALYIYGADTSGVSNCTGGCLSSWPAYQDTGSTTNLPTDISTIKRTDNGQIQYTYNGMPLYYFVSDSNGQVTGNNVSNFTVAKPTSASSSSTSNTGSSTSSSSSSNSSNYNY